MPKKFLKEKHLGFKKLAQSRFVGHMPKFKIWEVRLPRRFEQVDLAEEIKFFHRAAYFYHLMRQEVVATLKQTSDDPKLKKTLKVYQILNSQGNRIKDILLVKAVERGVAVIVGQYKAHGKQYVHYRIGDEDYVSLLSMTSWKNLPECEPLGGAGISTVSSEERQSILDEFADVGYQHQATVRIRSMNTMFTQILERINSRVNEHRRVYPLIKKKVRAGEITLIGPDLEEIPYHAESRVKKKPVVQKSQPLVLAKMAQKAHQFWLRAGGIVARMTRFKA